MTTGPSNSAGVAMEATEVMTGTSGNLHSDMAVAGMAGHAVGSTAGLRRRATTGEGAEPSQPSTSGRVTELSADLRELADLRDSGLLTEDEFRQEKRRLLERYRSQ